jgi:pyrroloquinoline quinone biosynthesis protein B
VTRRRSCTIAVGDGAGGWFLGNAGPDLDVALGECADLWPGAGQSTAPIHGVFLTDAELDHTLGLLSLRQAAELHMYATAAVRALLTHCGMLPTLESYTVIRWHEVRPGERFTLRYRDGRASPIWCEPFDASCGRLPRYARGSVVQGGGPGSGVVTGYRITDQRTARSVVLLPSVAVLGDTALKHIDQAHLVLVDGTFWVDDEMSQHGRGTATARSMGHLPVSGADGSLRLLGHPAGTQTGTPTGTRVVYTHINNTNPMLFEDGPERALLASAGASIAEDGAQYEL